MKSLLSFLAIVAALFVVERAFISAETLSNENIFLASQKSGLPAAFLDKAKTVITPGATLIFTDRPVDPTTQSAPNFQILVAQKDKPVKT